MPIDIKTGLSGLPDTVRLPPAPYVLVPGEPDSGYGSKVDPAEAALRILHARAAWLAHLVYRDLADLKTLLAENRAEDFVPFSEDGANTVACGFVLDGRAWLVFRGTDDDDDWVRNLSCVPFCHIGFNRCFAEIAQPIQTWIDRVAPKGHHFCIVGHSLGGALATLATRRIAGKHPVEMLCTFGAPRVLAPWSAMAFDDMEANLPSQSNKSKVRLRDVTYRFVDQYEMVCYTPPWFAGFRHVGCRVDCEDVRKPAGAAAPRPAPTPGAGKWEDAKHALAETVSAPVVGPLMLLIYGLYRLVFRVARAGPAHAMQGYALRIDPDIDHGFSKEQEARVRECAPARVPFTSRLIWRTLKWAGIILGLLLGLAALYGLVLLVWHAPWETLGGFLAFAAALFWLNYSRRRNERELYPYAAGKTGFGLWASGLPRLRVAPRKTWYGPGAGKPPWQP